MVEKSWRWKGSGGDGGGVGGGQVEEMGVPGRCAAGLTGVEWKCNGRDG